MQRNGKLPNTIDDKATVQYKSENFHDDVDCMEENLGARMEIHSLMASNSIVQLRSEFDEPEDYPPTPSIQPQLLDDRNIPELDLGHSFYDCALCSISAN
jgi:hypothetical protein